MKILNALNESVSTVEQVSKMDYDEVIQGLAIMLIEKKKNLKSTQIKLDSYYTEELENLRKHKEETEYSHVRK